MDTMLKIINSGDWHFAPKTICNKVIFRNGVNVALLDRINAVNTIIEYVQTNAVDLIAIPGDIFDKPDPDNATIQAVVEAIETLSNYAKIVVVKGNHEGRSIATGALASLKYRDNIHIFESPDSVSILVNGGQINLFLLPYPPLNTLKSHPDFKGLSPEEMNGSISGMMTQILTGFQAKIEQKAVNVLVGHFTVSTAKYSAEQMVPAFDISVSNDALIPFDVVCLGHLHLPQKYYSGSIARNGFGEADREVGFKVYTISEDKQVTEEFIPVPARNYKTFLQDEFVTQKNFDPEICYRIKGRVSKLDYDKALTKAKGLNLPFFKNDLELEVGTAGSTIGVMIAEPTLEEAISIWAKGKDGTEKVLPQLIVAAKEIEAKFYDEK